MANGDGRRLLSAVFRKLNKDKGPTVNPDLLQVVVSDMCQRTFELSVPKMAVTNGGSRRDVQYC